MKRTIEVVAGDVTIRATLTRVCNNYTSDELKRATEVLADRLMQAAQGLPFGFGARISQQKVKP